MSAPSSPRPDNELFNIVCQIREDVSAMRVQQEDTNKRLFGNGQPGELATMKAETARNSEWIMRADEREKTNRKWTALIATAFGTAASAMMNWFLKK